MEGLSLNQIKKFFFEYEGPTLNLKNIILSPFWPLFTQNPQKIFVSVLKFYVAATKYEKLKKKKKKKMLRVNFFQNLENLFLNLFARKH